ncbi:MAG: cyclic nucleotide-binding domain-containing protein [Defluviitaleaceae bacterium]|nr:cyclic nucleotide-binding domain-containing protein [Defluviitaleaceae bacterium]
MIDLTELRALSTAVTYPRGTVIIEENTTEPYSMYIVLKGKVRVFKNFRWIRETLLATLGPGAFFGEMSLFLKKPRSATVVTMEETIVLELTHENVLEILKSHPELSVSIMETLCGRMDHTSSVIAGLPQAPNMDQAYDDEEPVKLSDRIQQELASETNMQDELGADDDASLEEQPKKSQALQVRSQSRNR